MPTLLLDEVDAIFNKKSTDTDGLRACLNAGNKRGTRVPRCLPPSHDPVEFGVFCPKALAGIGGLPATITDRSIPIEMRRKQATDRVKRFRWREARELAAPLVAELKRWGESATAEVELELLKVEGLADEGCPLSSLDDRAWEQAWEPLVAVASLAGKEWRQQAIAAAVSLSGRRDDELDLGIVLLADIKAAFDDYPERVSFSTTELLGTLLLIDESPWRGWWSDPRADDLRPSKAAPRKLARMLKPFGVGPVDVKTPDGVTLKGYRLDDFGDALARYLVRPESSTDGQHPRPPRQVNSHLGSPVADQIGESATSAPGPRHPRSEPSLSSQNHGGRGSRPSEENDGMPSLGDWLARDGRWRSLREEPPFWPEEIVETRHSL
jgi:hypothetical protein